MLHQIKSLQNLSQSDLAGKTVLVRVDYNVPIDAGKVVDDLRIRASFKTVDFLRSAGAKVVLISHIEGKGGDSLQAVADKLAEIGQFGPVEFIADCPALTNDVLRAQIADLKARIAVAPAGSVFLLENLRKNPGEKANDPEFSQILASVADLYVGDAFSVSHRTHASVVGIPALLSHYAGFQILEEIKHLEEGLNPPHPFIFILGGAKFETKLPLIEKFIDKADKVLIGGALFNDLLKARGLSVGKSLTADQPVDLSGIAMNPKLIIPQDVIVQNITTMAVRTVGIDQVGADEAIMDIGPSLITELKAIFDQYKNENDSANVDVAGDAGADAKTTIAVTPFILWNGPMGNYEPGFKEQTISLAQFLIDQKAHVLLGGGDSSAAVADLGIEHDPEIASRFYISTGGGAMIDYLQNETLPGIEALK